MLHITGFSFLNMWSMVNLPLCGSCIQHDIHGNPANLQVGMLGNDTGCTCAFTYEHGPRPILTPYQDPKIRLLWTQISKSANFESESQNPVTKPSTKRWRRFSPSRTDVLVVLPLPVARLKCRSLCGQENMARHCCFDRHYDRDCKIGPGHEACYAIHTTHNGLSAALVFAQNWGRFWRGRQPGMSTAFSAFSHISIRMSFICIKNLFTFNSERDSRWLCFLTLQNTGFTNSCFAGLSMMWDRWVTLVFICFTP